MKYLVFSTIGNENFGDESMVTNYINKNIGWNNTDLITPYKKIASSKVNCKNIFNPFEIFREQNKIRRIIFYIKTVIFPNSLVKKIKLPREIKEYEAFIMSGGGNLNSEYINTVIYIYLISKLFSINNKKVYFRPQSIGPFEGVKGIYGKFILKKIINMSTEFLVRETESYKLATSLVNHKKIKIQIDDAWTLDKTEIENKEIIKSLNKNMRKIGISARPWNAKDIYLEKLSLVVNKALKNGYEVYFIPIAFGGDKNYIDNAFIKHTFKNKKSVFFIEDYLNLERCSSENIKWIISKMDKCIGLSYHFNVYSKSLNKKTISLYSDKYYYIKNYGLYSLLKCEEDVINISNLDEVQINKFLE